MGPLASPRSAPRSPATPGNATPSSGSNVRRKSLAILRQALVNASSQKAKGERRQKETDNQNKSIGNGDIVTGISSLNTSSTIVNDQSQDKDKSVKDNGENDKPQDVTKDDEETITAEINKDNNRTNSGSKEVSKKSGEEASNPSNDHDNNVEESEETNNKDIDKENDNVSRLDDNGAETISNTNDASNKAVGKNDANNQEGDVPDSDHDKSKRVSGQGMPRPKTPPRNKKKLYNARAISTPQVNKTVLGENVTFLGESVMELSAITVLSPASTVSDPDSRRGSQSRAKDDTDAVSFRFKKGGRDLFDKLVDAEDNAKQAQENGKRTT